MRIYPHKLTGIGTAGATGVALMVLHILGHLVGWGWPILYIFLILVGIGMESDKKEKTNVSTWND